MIVPHCHQYDTTVYSPSRVIVKGHLSAVPTPFDASFRAVYPVQTLLQAGDADFVPIDEKVWMQPGADAKSGLRRLVHDH